MDSRPCATTSPSRSSGVSKYTALLSGLERSCRVTPATGSCFTPHTESRKSYCAAPRLHLAESPGSFLALSSSASADAHSLSSSFASYSPLATQRRSEAAIAAARTPSALFEVRVYRRRGKGTNGGTRQGCEAFAQNVRRGHPCASFATTSSIDAPAVAVGLLGPHSYSTRAAPASRPGDAQRRRGAGSGAHEAGVAAHCSLTSDHYLSYYLARYGGRRLPQSSCPSALTAPSLARRDDLCNNALVPASEWSDFSETLVSIGSSSMCSCAALPVFTNIPECSPIVAPGDGARVEAGDDTGDFDDEMEDRDDNAPRSASLLIPATHLASPAERGFGSTSSGTNSAGDDNAVAPVGPTEGVSAAAVGVAATPAPFSPLAAEDPLLILLNRLPLEKKLFIAVNWLSLVSTCLTYFLRPSQVLYTFIFTSGHSVLHTAPHSRRYLHPRPDSLSTRRPSALHASLSGGPTREATCKRWEAVSKATGTTSESIHNAVLERRQNMGDDYHSRGSCGTERGIADVLLARKDWAAAQRLSSSPTPTSRRLQFRLCWYAHRPVTSAFLCGMEMECIVVHLRRRWQRGRKAQTRGEGAAADALSSTDDVMHQPDPCGAIQGPPVAFLGEHLISCACAALYVRTLLDEGDALWVSHTALVQWHVCSLAFVVLSLLKCLRVLF
ncbi:hypothetical protein CGC21_5835 [Leishmania donovani]|uniref:Uncharacterized protein n=1 Tax=Leishmania donovani TaxID=5661 RepID=A0A504X855_LEIDO|nr:hypothetical protein CGC21_5835 [Leishmania donovani]